MSEFTDYQVSRDASRKWEEFSDELRSALVIGQFETWAEKLGFMRRSDALSTTFPIPVDAAGYKAFDGDIKFRSLGARSLTMKTRPWTDGVEIEEAKLRAPDFEDWTGQPGIMAQEWLRHPQTMVAEMLAEGSLDGPLLDFYADKETKTPSAKRLFASGHPYNVLKTGLGNFDNRLTTTQAQIKDGTFFDACNAHFRSIRSASGKPMGLKFSEGGHCLLPATRENLFKNTLQFDTIVRTITNVAGDQNVAAVTQNNIYKSGIGYTVSDELEDQDHFYAFASGRPGLYPWVVQVGTKLKEIVHDYDSELYKRHLKLGLAFVGEANVEACLPHAIVRVEITG